MVDEFEEKVPTRYNVIFEHPLVGSKGEMVKVQLEADNAEEALTLAKEDTIFMGKVNEWQSDENPIKDSYFRAFPAGNEEVIRAKVSKDDKWLW